MYRLDQPRKAVLRVPQTDCPGHELRQSRVPGLIICTLCDIRFTNAYFSTLIPKLNSTEQLDGGEYQYNYKTGTWKVIRFKT